MRLILASLALLCPVWGWSQASAQIPAADLVKAVISNELGPSSSAPVLWKYRLEKDVDGRHETREVVETARGSIDKLVATGGKPLSPQQARAEDDRILHFSQDPDAQRKARAAQQKDAEQCNKIMQLMPSAFIFQYAGQSGDLVKITFKPNPSFSASSREAKVLQQLAGEMWVNPKELRLASIDGRLMNEVKFAGGLLGYLEQGGRFSVKRAELAHDDWEVTELHIDMHGKALLFKNICVQQNETHSDFERVSPDLTLTEAANLLLKQTLVASKRPLQ